VPQIRYDSARSVASAGHPLTGVMAPSVKYKTTSYRD